MSQNFAGSATASCPLEFNERAVESAEVQHLAVSDNRESPLLRLPPEILERILVHAADGLHLQGWIILGHICSMLREVLLGVGRLWGDAIYAWPDGRHRDELLERAGPTAPLRLLVSDSGGVLDAAQFAAEYLPRARVIEAKQDPFVQWFLQNIDRSPLLHLEEISLYINIAGYETQAAAAYPTRQTPQLRDVTLIDVYWPFHAPNLTSLKAYAFASTNIFEASQLLEVLGKSKCLEILDLYRGLPYLPDEMLSMTTVSLPCLNNLKVRDRRPHALRFWRLLSIPFDAQVVFTLDCAEHEDPAYRAPTLFHDSVLFKHHLLGRQPSTLNTSVCEDMLTVTIYSAPNADDKQVNASFTRGKSDETLKLELTYILQDDNFFHPVNGSTLSRAIHCVYNGLNLSNIVRQYLSLSRVYGESASSWIIMLGDLEHVVHLEIRYFDSSACAVLGSPYVRETGDTSLPPLPFPQLQTLELQNSVMFTEHAAPADDFEGVSSAELMDMLRSRSGQGCPLSTIVFYDLEFKPDQSDQDEESDAKNRQLLLEDITTQFPECEVEFWVEGDRLEL